MSAWETVEEILRDDVPHRKGWKPSTRTLLDVHASMRDEVDELRDEIIVGGRAGTVEELADAQATIYHMAQKLCLTREQLDAEVERKLRLRFLFVCAHGWHFSHFTLSDGSTELLLPPGGSGIFCPGPTSVRPAEIPVGMDASGDVVAVSNVPCPAPDSCPFGLPEAHMTHDHPNPWAPDELERLLGLAWVGVMGKENPTVGDVRAAIKSVVPHIREWAKRNG